MPMTTTGDKIQDRSLADAGGKGLFTKELEEGLFDGRIDFCVHSSKDMPTKLPEGLEIIAYLEREDPRDVLISPVAATLEELPFEAVVGTSSLRRQALVKRLRPDIATVTFRGNVQTRLRKLEEGQVAATLLAYAGLRRLDLASVATQVLSLDDFPPAPGQGAICIEARSSDIETRALIAAIQHDATATALTCERAFLETLDGSCRTPLAGYAEVEGRHVNMRGMILTPDGSQVHELALEGDAAQAQEIGRKLGSLLREMAGTAFFDGWS
ncbi:porphobilinogen deaminase [Limoniibacter endophyticus]|uniref:Hydroxymethylbilane synthase n=1 Tax=Limoniibacter endophyticus TaxID=1565040 RepID=A0A8J3GHD4_9HYPH|nr:porphobilinogen deaminase [Limoniibacter endophyticus]